MSRNPARAAAPLPAAAKAATKPVVQFQHARPGQPGLAFFSPAPRPLLDRGRSSAAAGPPARSPFEGFAFCRLKFRENEEQKIANAREAKPVPREIYEATELI